MSMNENLRNYRIFFDENLLAQITTATLPQILAKADGQSQSVCKSFKQYAYITCSIIQK